MGGEAEVFKPSLLCNLVESNPIQVLHLYFAEAWDSKLKCTSSVLAELFNGFTKRSFYSNLCFYLPKDFCLFVLLFILVTFYLLSGECFVLYFHLCGGFLAGYVEDLHSASFSLIPCYRLIFVLVLVETFLWDFGSEFLIRFILSWLIHIFE